MDYRATSRQGFCSPLLQGQGEWKKIKERTEGWMSRMLHKCSRNENIDLYMFKSTQIAITLKLVKPPNSLNLSLCSKKSCLEISRTVQINFDVTIF